MKDFQFQRFQSLSHARRAAMKRGVSLVAGGQSLIRDMKLGLVGPDTLVDLSDLLGHDISVEGRIVTIQAGCTHAEVANSSVLRHHYPTLAELVGHIGDPSVRHRGTIGGAVAAYEINGDYPAALLGLDATVHTSDRDIKANVFFRSGFLSTALTPGEIVLGVSFDIPYKSAYTKILNPAARYAMVGVFVASDKAGTLRIAITGASEQGAFRWTEAEHTQLGPPFGQGGSYPHFVDINFAEDLFADAEYREHLARVLTHRTLMMAASDGPCVSVISHGSRLSTVRYEVP